MRVGGLTRGPRILSLYNLLRDVMGRSRYGANDRALGTLIVFVAPLFHEKTRKYVF